MLKTSSLLFSFIALGVAAAPAWADYPDKPIRMVVGYAPGGGADNLIRPIAERLTKILGQPIVMDYKAGAGGVIAAELVALSSVGRPTSLKYSRFTKISLPLAGMGSSRLKNLASAAK